MTKHSWFKRGRPQAARPGGGPGAGLGRWPPRHLEGPPPAHHRAPSATPGTRQLSALGSARTALLGRSSEPQFPLVRRRLQGCTAEPLGGRPLLRGSRPRGPNYRVEWGDTTWKGEGCPELRGRQGGVVGQLQAVLDSGFQAGDTHRPVAAEVSPDGTWWPPPASPRVTVQSDSGQ